MENGPKIIINMKIVPILMQLVAPCKHENPASPREILQQSRYLEMVSECWKRSHASFWKEEVVAGQHPP